MVVADLPMVVTMFSRRVGVLRYFALALGALPDVGHRGASFRVEGCLRNPHSVCHVHVDGVNLRCALVPIMGQPVETSSIAGLRAPPRP